jgi:hypothetical protein
MMEQRNMYLMLRPHDTDTAMILTLRFVLFSFIFVVSFSDALNGI